MPRRQGTVVRVSLDLTAEELATLDAYRALPHLLVERRRRDGPPRPMKRAEALRHAIMGSMARAVKRAER